MKNTTKVIGYETTNFTGKKSFGSCLVRLWENTIECELLNGCHPDWEELLVFLLKDKDVQIGIREYIQKGRKNSFNIITKEDEWRGESKFIAVATQDWYIKSKKFLVHVSCFGKIKGFAPMYIGDFAELACYDLGYAEENGHKIEPKMWYAQPQELDTAKVKPSVDELHHFMGIEGGDN